METPSSPNAPDVHDQLAFIEGMIREGQRSVETWGWAFVLWGVGHLTAMTWAWLWPDGKGIPWAIVMGGCAVLMAVGGLRARGRRQVWTATGRAIGATWWAFGVSLTLVWVVGGLGGSMSDELFLGTFFVLLGAANFITGVTVRLLAQSVAGVLWWLGAGVAFLVHGSSPWVLVGAALVCEVGFGLYLMRLEMQSRSNHAHPARA